MKKIFIFILVILIIIIILNYNNEKFEQIQRYPSCIKSEQIGLKVFYLLEKHGLLEQTKLIDAYNLLICLYQELKTQNCNQELITKYNDQIKELDYIKTDIIESNIKLLLDQYKINILGLSYELENIIIGCIHIIEQSSQHLGLFPDDVIELIRLNKMFYKKYISLIQKLDNC